jgi:hypothetical protein
MPLDISQPLASTCVCRHDRWNSFDEDLALTTIFAATKAANRYHDRYRPALPRKITQCSTVSAMNAVRPSLAERAQGRSLSWVRPYGDPISFRQDMTNNQLGGHECENSVQDG